MIRRLLLSSLLLLAGCTTAKIDYNGAHVEFSRVFTSTAFEMGPDGTIKYNSDPNAAAIQSANQAAAQAVKDGVALGLKIGAAANGVPTP